MSWLRRLRRRTAGDLYPEPRHRPGYRVASWLFTRLLGTVYLVAFLSIWVQVEGLYGRGGILPVAKFLEVVSAQIDGVERFWRVPTLLWLGAGDGSLHLLCGAGVGLALLVILGRLRTVALAGLWVLYLSLVAVGQEFLSFQWDVLLLEAGLVAVFLAPAWRRARGEPPPAPSRLALWLLWWLLFRLMFGSGVVKLTSGDPTWFELTALVHHYQTQPLPNPFAWWAHQLPLAAQRFSTAAMFFVELLVPFLIFAPARWRRLGCLLLIAFQLLIALTGNYAFFNLLTIVLCVPLLDDDWWERRFGLRPSPPPRRGLRARDAAVAPLGLLVALLSAAHLWSAVRPAAVWPAPVQAVSSALAPFRSINSYGLFRVMTTRRPEIVVEGRLGGGEWREYLFRWKPGPADRRPPFVAPHQPRLDWQLWFAALGDPRANDWFFFFMARLAQASPEALALLAEDPFEGEAPDELRARLWEYRFTGREERRRTGAWWRRDFLGVYLPSTPAERLARLFPDAR